MRLAAHAISIVAVLIALVANIAGYWFNLYDRFWGFDELLHGYTLFALTLATVDYCYGKVLLIQGRPVLYSIAVILIGVGIGGIWEIGEWAYDALTPANSIRGKYDTMVDIVADAIGAALAAFLSLWLANRRERENSEA